MRIISDKGFQNKKWDTTFLRKVVRSMRRFVNPGNTAFAATGHAFGEHYNKWGK